MGAMRSSRQSYRAQGRSYREAARKRPHKAAFFVKHWQNDYFFTSFAIAAPRSPGERTVTTPAASIAANLPSAVP